MAAPRKRTVKRRRGRLTHRRWLSGWVLPVGVLVVVGFLYYRPLSSYVETRGQLVDRRSEVVSLREEKARVTARLARTQSLEVLARDARGIGYVRPGEQLFIVKGIADWRRARVSSR